MNTKDDPKKLIGEVQILRIRVATAESEVKVLRDLAVQAKRRRKEAKRLARQARKQFKQFKLELAELQQTLAKAEAKLFQSGRPRAGQKNGEGKANRQTWCPPLESVEDRRAQTPAGFASHVPRAGTGHAETASNHGGKGRL